MTLVVGTSSSKVRVHRLGPKFLKFEPGPVIGLHHQIGDSGLLLLWHGDSYGRVI